MPAARRFPPPWSVEAGETYFVVKDNDGQQLAYVLFDDPRSAAKPLTRDEARRIAARISSSCRSWCAEGNTRAGSNVRFRGQSGHERFRIGIAQICSKQ